MRSKSNVCTKNTKTKPKIAPKFPLLHTNLQSGRDLQICAAFCAAIPMYIIDYQRTVHTQVGQQKSDGVFNH